jgi:crotonobetainyl-CoA:carnitine CoA-transferase CaiB-like acyl-CoA transferase
MGFFKRTEAPIEAKDGMKRLTATDVVAKAPQWCTDPRFRDDSSRGDNGAAISERMAAWSADRSTAEALGALERAGIPGAAVLTPQGVLDDPQVAATGVLEAVDYPGPPASCPGRARAGVVVGHRAVTWPTRTPCR